MSNQERALPASAAFAPRRRRFKRDWLIAYLFLSPWVIGFVIFTAGPFVASLVLSFSQWDLLVPPKWVGLGNYVQIFTNDPHFAKTLFNTAYYVVFQVPGSNLVAFCLALLLNQKLRGISIFRTLFYLPTVTSGVATAVLWMWIFNSNYGLLNIALASIGIHGPNWLFSTTWSLPALIIMSFWTVGNPMIIYLAGLQGVPQHLVEACEIDGGGWWTKIWHITIPMITPSIFYNVVMAIIGSFQVFTAAFVITNGGPAESTLFYVLYLYWTAFRDLSMGYAAGLAWILFLIILALTAVQFGLARRWVYYAGTR